jgi:hypothetical protein
MVRLGQDDNFKNISPLPTVFTGIIEINYCEDWKMMFSQLSPEHVWIYSLKVFAHFRSK